jgi:hypothetical protein
MKSRLSSVVLAHLRIRDSRKIEVNAHRNCLSRVANDNTNGRRWLSLSSDGNSDETGDETGDETQKKIVLYKGRGIRVFRVLVRFKIFQLSGIAGSAIPLATMLQAGEATLFNALLAGGLLFGGGVASTALWYYSRRYVGEMSLLLPPPPEDDSSKAVVRFSVLDFWGNRENVDVSIQDILPVEGISVDKVPFFPVTVTGDRQYVLSLRYGHIANRNLLNKVLTGKGKLTIAE